MFGTILAVTSVNGLQRVTDFLVFASGRSIAAFLCRIHLRVQAFYRRRASSVANFRWNLVTRLSKENGVRTFYFSMFLVREEGVFPFEGANGLSVGEAGLRLRNRSTSQYRVRDRPTILVGPSNFLTVVLNLLVNVRAIFGRGDHVERSFKGRERVGLRVTFVPVNRATSVPIRVLLARYCGVFSRLAQDGGDEVRLREREDRRVRAFLLVRVINEHVARRNGEEVICGVNDRLIAPNSRTNQHMVRNAPVNLHNVTRDSQHVVRQSHRRASVKRDGVVRKRVVLSVHPFRLFRARRTFGVSGVKMNAISAYQFMGTIRVGNWFVPNHRLDSTVRRFSNDLVVAVRGVRLGAFSSRVHVFLADYFRLTIRCVGRHPGRCFRPFKFTMYCRLHRVGFKGGNRRVPTLQVVPSFVRRGGLRSIPTNRVSVVFVHVRISANFGQRSFRVPIVPPIPYRFPYLCP